MKTKTITLYEFDELNPELQDRAIENLADTNYEWWDSVYDDAKQIGLKLTEFDLDRHRHADGNFINGAVETANLILKFHGDTCESYKTASQFLKDRDALVEKYSDGLDKSIVSEDNEREFDSDCDQLEADFLRSILVDYSIMLQREYEYLCSREAIIETIRANEYTFNERGEIER